MTVSILLRQKECPEEPCRPCYGPKLCGAHPRPNRQLGDRASPCPPSRMTSASKPPDKSATEDPLATATNTFMLAQTRAIALLPGRRLTNQRNNPTVVSSNPSPPRSTCQRRAYENICFWKESPAGGGTYGFSVGYGRCSGTCQEGSWEGL